MKIKNQFLPTTLKEAKSRGWDRLDIILITGDAYVDHPSFGAAVVGRYLESLGVRVGIIAAPDLNTSADFTCLGEPLWFFGVTAGNMDSLLMLKTASKKSRSDDAYLPGGAAGGRPERATIIYCNKLRELFSKPQILIGGLEASLRRYAHYDYWDNKVRRSILLDTRADLLVFGMAEAPLEKIISDMRKGHRLKKLRGIRGTGIVINEKECKKTGADVIIIPSYDEVIENKALYADAAKIIYNNQNPGNAKTLLQKHANRYVCVYPPAMPLLEKEMDSIYALPFTRLPHTKYKQKIPAYEMIRFSVTAMRGCFGGCSFCALTVHQGKSIQNRSTKSIVEEVKKITMMEGFSGYVSDIGGPTANMYKLGCSDPQVESSCKKLSCLYPKICRFLKTDHNELLRMLRSARAVKRIKKIFVASGVRFDLANCSPEYIRALARYHVSGQLKVAPEHCHSRVLSLMKKPDISQFEAFRHRFMEESKKAGLEQYLVPYFISAYPGCGLKEQITLTDYLKKNNLRPRQAQEFIPLPMTPAADMYYTGIDPFTGKKVMVVKSDKDRKEQKALIHYFKPENARIVQRVRNTL